MIHIPQNSLVQAMYALLNGKISCNVYDDVPANAQVPYVTFGEGRTETNSAKMLDLTDTTQEIHIFTEYQGRKQCNDIAEEIIAALSSEGVLDLAGDYSMRSGEVAEYVAYSEDTQGYHGIVTYAAKIQYVGG